MDVRPITKADFDRVVEVIDHWWGGPISTFAHPIFFYELGGAALVVEEGSQMIGFLLGFVVAGQPARACRVTATAGAATSTWSGSIPTSGAAAWAACSTTASRETAGPPSASA